MYQIGNGMLIRRVYVWYRDLVHWLNHGEVHWSAPSHGLAIAWKLMVHDSDDFCYDYSALSQDFKL